MFAAADVVLATWPKDLIAAELLFNIAKAPTLADRINPQLHRVLILYLCSLGGESLSKPAGSNKGMRWRSELLHGFFFALALQPAPTGF